MSIIWHEPLNTNKDSMCKFFCYRKLALENLISTYLCLYTVLFFTHKYFVDSLSRTHSLKTVLDWEYYYYIFSKTISCVLFELFTIDRTTYFCFFFSFPVVFFVPFYIVIYSNFLKLEKRGWKWKGE